MTDNSLKSSSIDTTNVAIAPVSVPGQPAGNELLPSSHVFSLLGAAERACWRHAAQVVLEDMGYRTKATAAGCDFNGDKNLLKEQAVNDPEGFEKQLELFETALKGANILDNFQRCLEVYALVRTVHKVDTRWKQFALKFDGGESEAATILDADLKTLLEWDRDFPQLLPQWTEWLKPLAVPPALPKPKPPVAAIQQPPAPPVANGSPAAGSGEKGPKDRQEFEEDSETAKKRKQLVADILDLAGDIPPKQHPRTAGPIYQQSLMGKAPATLEKLLAELKAIKQKASQPAGNGAGKASESDQNQIRATLEKRLHAELVAEIRGLDNTQVASQLEGKTYDELKKIRDDIVARIKPRAENRPHQSGGVVQPSRDYRSMLKRNWDKLALLAIVAALLFGLYGSRLFDGQKGSEKAEQVQTTKPEAKADKPSVGKKAAAPKKVAQKSEAKVEDKVSPAKAETPKERRERAYKKLQEDRSRFNAVPNN